MKYDIPLLLDMQNQPIGVFSFFTSGGQIVVIFQNKDSVQILANAIGAPLRQQNQKIGSFTIEAASIQEVVGQLIEMDPTLGDGSTNFIKESDPLYKTLLSQVQ